ncbi:MAG: ABC transporter ATP-binding protein/permease [Bacilli bacterium]|nr:ABC transporter ATP-binding protein/permease [Bacilli bacterium]
MSEERKYNQRQSTPLSLPGRRGGGRFSKQHEKPKDAKKSFARLFHYISSFKMIFIALIIVVIIYTIANVTTNIAVKNVVSSLGTFISDTNSFKEGLEPNKDNFFLWLIILASLRILYCILQYLSSLLGAYLSAKTVKKMRNDLFEKIVHLPIAYTDSHRHGDLMSRMTNDVDNISSTVSSSITSLISGILTLLGCLAIMLFYSPLLTLISLLILSITILFSYLLSKHIRPLFKKQQAILGVLNSESEEMITGYRTVMAYNHQEDTMRAFNKTSDELTAIGIKAHIIAGSMGPIMNFISNLGYFLVCLFGALAIYANIGGGFAGPLDAAIVIMFLSTTKQFSRPINEIAQLYASILTALAGAERVFAVLDEKSEDFSHKEEFNLEEIHGDICFEHIRFGYEKNHPVLKDFDVDIYSGHKIALVGATGSGKTTIVNLLLRYYDIDAGRILIDGHDIFNISKKNLRNAISIVLQDPVLFSDTIENNVRYARKDASDEEVDKALSLANCTGFINRLPDGKKTLLSEGAENISQGQRQLITIARAILADPKILILDEATSSVDTRTEKHIQDALVELMKNRTSIIIAHRLSTIEDADLIIVLDKGTIVEMGNHQELLEKKGVYHSLYQTQFKGLKT